MTRCRPGRGVRGVVLIEYMVTLPLLLVLLLGLVNTAQLVLLHAQLDHLTREAGRLGARRLSVDEVWTTLLAADAPLDMAADGQLIFSVIGRRSDADGTPWIQSQAVRGGRSYVASQVGTAGGAANVPGIASVPLGVTLTAVETAYTFAPFIDPPAFMGLTLPTFVQDAAYF